MYRFPIFLDLQHAVPLVIGDGALAVAKTRTLLLRAGKVEVMANKLPPALLQFEKLKLVRWLKPLPSDASDDDWKKILLHRPMVVIDPKGQSAVVERLHPLCLSLGLPINVADNNDKSSFSFGAMLDRRPLTIAMATEGIAPLLATYLRGELEQAIAPHFAVIMAEAKKYRGKVNKVLPMGLKRRLFWQDFLHGEIGDAIAKNQIHKVAEKVDSLLSRLQQGKHKDFIAGNRVHVVALPVLEGDDDMVDNLTMAMVRAIKQADLLLVSAHAPYHDAMTLARREVELHHYHKNNLPKKFIQKIMGSLHDGGAVTILTEQKDMADTEQTLQRHHINHRIIASPFHRDSYQGWAVRVPLPSKTTSKQ